MTQSTVEPVDWIFLVLSPMDASVKLEMASEVACVDCVEVLCEPRSLSECLDAELCPGMSLDAFLTAKQLPIAAPRGCWMRAYLQGSSEGEA